MDTQLKDKPPVPPSPLHAVGGTSALGLAEVTSEIERRIALYRSAPRGDNPAKADALEAVLWWVEAQQR